MNIFLEQLSFSRGRKKILSDLQLTIPDGEITVIAGSNGCGKSTLLKIIAGLLRPDSGNIRYDEKALKEFSAAALAQKRAILLQNPYAPGSMKVKDLLELGRFARRSGKATTAKAIDAALNNTGCTGLKDRNIGSLSGGEKRKVFLAAALAQEPELLLLDELEAGLDADFCSKLPGLLKKLQSTGKMTIIMVMHDLDLALHCGDNLLALKDGKVEFFSPVSAADFPGRLREFAGKSYHFEPDGDRLRAMYKF